MRQVNGFTLLELIVTLSIVTLSLSLGIPAIADWHQQAKSRSLQYALVHSIQYTRKQAVHLRTPVVLCPGETGCVKDWGDTLMIFTDDNSNATFDEGEILLKTISLGGAGNQLSWNRSKAYLRFASEGISGLTGTLKYCSESDRDQHNFGIVVSRVGRVRITDDVNCS